MSLYLDDNTQSITVDAGYVSTVLIMPQNERYAITEDGAIIDEDNWVESDGEPVVAGDTIVVDGAVNIASHITVTSTSFTIRGAQTPIETITVNGQVLDFTTGSISGAEGSTGLTVTLNGFESEAEAFNDFIPPTANAGVDQSVEAGETFILDGSASTDTDGTIAEYRWTQTAGDIVTLDLTDPVRPVGVAPSTANAQTLTFSLITVDDDGVESVADTVDIDVAAEVQNDVLSIIDKISFTFESDGMITAFPGRANRETFRLKPSDPTGLILDEGWFDFEANDVKRVEISILETTGVKIISSDTDSITLEKGKLHARMGDMPIKNFNRINVYPSHSKMEDL